LLLISLFHSTRVEVVQQRQKDVKVSGDARATTFFCHVSELSEWSFSCST
jgi:hypothetical protein